MELLLILLGVLVLGGALYIGGVALVWIVFDEIRKKEEKKFPEV